MSQDSPLVGSPSKGQVARAIGKGINDAMLAIKARNASLKGVLPQTSYLTYQSDFDS